MDDTVSLHCVLEVTVWPGSLSITQLYLIYHLFLTQPSCPQAGVHMEETEDLKGLASL